VCFCRLLLRRFPRYSEGGRLEHNEGAQRTCWTGSKHGRRTAEKLSVPAVPQRQFRNSDPDTDAVFRDAQFHRHGAGDLQGRGSREREETEGMAAFGFSINQSINQ